MVKENKNEEPVSRFWACFFAVGIFALFWTQKMKKTRIWILMAVPISFVFSIGGGFFRIMDESLNSSSPTNELILGSYIITLFVIV